MKPIPHYPFLKLFGCDILYTSAEAYLASLSLSFPTISLCDAVSAVHGEI